MAILRVVEKGGRRVDVPEKDAKGNAHPDNALPAVAWRLRVFVARDPKTGRRKYLTQTFERKKEAEAEERRLGRMKDHGSLTAPSKVPFSEYLQTWLEEVKKPQGRGRTIDDYRGIIRRYIDKPPEGAPPIGSIRLDRLTPAAFQTLYAFLWDVHGLHPRTLAYLHAILRQALGYAVKTGALPRNPTDHVRPAKQAKEGEAPAAKAMRAMSKEEATRFLEAARPDRYFALWALLLTGGLRPGEALGLQWPDVDLDAGKIHVRRSLTRRGVRAGGEEGPTWALTEPKTARARRVVVLPPLAVQALREWRATQAKERLKLGSEYENHGLVFATEFGKPLDLGNLHARSFRRIMARAELGTWTEVQVGRRVKKLTRRFKPGFRVYDLRHTCATLLLLAGENPKIVSERLGHASVSLTLDTYSHVLPSMQEESAAKLEAMFGT